MPSLVEKEKEAWENGRNKLVLEISKGIGFGGGSNYSFDLAPPKGKDGVRSGGGLGDLRPPRATPASRPPELGGPSAFNGGVAGSRPEFRPPPPNNGWGARATVGHAAPGLRDNAGPTMQRTRTQPPLMYRESPKHAQAAPRFDRPPQQQRDTGGWGQRDSGSWGSQQRDNAPKGNWGRSNDSGWGRPAQSTQGGW